MRRLIPNRKGKGGNKQNAKAWKKRRAARRWWLRPILYGGLAAAALGSASWGVYWSFSSGFLERTALRIETAAIEATIGAGLAVNEVLVEGRTEATKDQLLRTVGIRRGDSILALDTQAIRARLIGLGWVADATVERRLPGTVYLRLWERKAMAIWQREGKFVLVDRTGAVIGSQGLDRFTHLKIIVGDDAPRHAPALLDMLATAPPLMKRVRAAVWVSGRRWNLRLYDGIDIRLPEENAQNAWTRLATLERDKQLLSQDIIAIDLRIHGRLVVQRRGAAARAPGNST